MTNPADPRRSAQVLMHHDKKIEDSLWRALVKTCRDPQWPSGRVWTEEQIQNWLEPLRRDWIGSAGFFFPHPWKDEPTKYQNPVQVSYVLRMTPRYGLSNGRWAEIPRFEEEGWNWVALSANAKDLLHTSEPDMRWYLERVRDGVQFFEPDFAAGALDTQLAKGFRENPREFAWPVLVYGPEQVTQIGRERLLGAPVLLAEELPFGGIWLQVSENPFVADKAALKSLAAYLKLKVAPL